jgi:hypothetical protein
MSAAEYDILSTLEKIKIIQESPSICGNFEAFIQEGVANLNLIDGDYFDHTQFDSKINDKNTPPSKYLRKEAAYISKMVLYFNGSKQPYWRVIRLC